MSNFMGKDGFQWFVGVVEDRQDPKKLGRVRVRCLGYHTENHGDLPTSDLPWAHPMNPITSATVSGVGQTPLGVVEGTWVVGFFQDGAEAQQPIIFGTLPGFPKNLPVKDAGKGFQDRLNGNYPKYKDEPDTNRLAVNDTNNPHPTLTLRKADRDLAVGTAQIDGVTEGVAQTASDLDTEISGVWNEPVTDYASTYPHNHVMETEGGHLREYDDTVNAKRIHERHASGTAYEVFDDGTKVTRVVSNNYQITAEDDFVHIKGTGRQTFDKGLRVRVNGLGAAGNNYSIEVGNGSNLNIEVNGGNINLTTLQTGADGGDININASRKLNIQAGTGVELTTNSGDINMNTVPGKVNIKGDEINLN
tara:strand:+ start:222 stop:1307 length:1086 start_codon:yes stop_codon:yes gene_type:complete